MTPERKSLIIPYENDNEVGNAVDRNSFLEEGKEDSGMMGVDGHKDQQGLRKLLSKSGKNGLCAPPVLENSLRRNSIWVVGFASLRQSRMCSSRSFISWNEPGQHTGPCFEGPISSRSVDGGHAKTHLPRKLGKDPLFQGKTKQSEGREDIWSFPLHDPKCLEKSGTVAA